MAVQSSFMSVVSDEMIDKGICLMSWNGVCLVEDSLSRCSCP